MSDEMVIDMEEREDAVACNPHLAGVVWWRLYGYLIYRPQQRIIGALLWRGGDRAPARFLRRVRDGWSADWHDSSQQARWLKRHIHYALLGWFRDCPLCGAEIDMGEPPWFVTERSGQCSTDMGTDYWFEGTQTCPRCLYRFPFGDSSL